MNFLEKGVQELTLGNIFTLGHREYSTIPLCIWPKSLYKGIWQEAKTNPLFNL